MEKMCERFSKISIVDQNLYFWPKFRFLSNISIFDRNFDFWPQFRFLAKKITVWRKFQTLKISNGGNEFGPTI